MESLLGTWKLEKTEGFDAYMKDIGVNMVLRKLASLAGATETWSRDADTWTLDIKNKVKHININFQLGVEFEETTGDGRKVKSTITLDGDRLVHEQKGPGESRITRSVEGDILHVEFVAVAKGGTCHRWFKLDPTAK